MPTLAEIDAEIARRQQGFSLADIDAEIAKRQPAKSPSFGDEILGGLETAGTVISSAVAEPAAGIAGLATGVLTGDPAAAAAVVEGARDRLTYEPESETAKRNISAIGEVIQPAAEAFDEAGKTLGGATLEATGSPELAAMAETIPTALLEIAGAASFKGISKLKSGKALDKVIQASTPSIDQLKSASRQVFKEISDSGSTVKPKALAKLTRNIERSAKEVGASRRTTSEVYGVIDDFAEVVESGRAISLDELDQLRTTAQNVAKSNNPSIKAPAISIIDEIDGFLDDAGVDVLNRPKGAKDVGAEYRAARKMWGRARRAELIKEAFENAKDTASGYENGLRIEMRKLFKNKRKKQFFTNSELAAMQRVSQGTSASNKAKLLGRLGFSEGQAINMVNPLLGSAAGGAVFGIEGGIAVPLIGQVSKALAQRLTAKSARFVDQVVRAGGNADNIAKAYIQNTPKAQRSAAELAQLFVRNDIDLSTVKSAMAKDAADIAKQARAFKGGALAGGVLKPEDEE